MMTIESSGTCRSNVFSIASISHDFISLYSVGFQGSDPSQIEIASFFEWASTPTAYFGRPVPSCICAFILLPFISLSRTGAGGCCKVAYKYSGSCAPSRWFPPAFKHESECGPHGLTHVNSRTSPMRTASGYQSPAVPYHTPVRVSLSTPNFVPVSGNTQYITNTNEVTMPIALQLLWDMMQSLREVPFGCLST